jgi:hypothetical protein
MYRPGDPLDPYYDAIGRIAMSGSALELAVGALYADIVGISPKEVGSRGQPFARLIAACKRADVADPARLQTVLDAAKSCYEDRNRVLHAMFYEPKGDDDPGYRIAYKTVRDSLLPERQEWSLEQLWHLNARTLTSLVEVAQMRDQFLRTQ